ncbi:translation initiation factor IF-2 [Marivirga sp. S37H4]|uniref:Translation initiation factor IF-2 n=1 Tax=Marivirga aurantiaca TaxID=2802615 RepID=A0A934X1F5_9BACT|nr:translation initiation factor IF-2 [Marivirga aurantiaca]MBK6266721.1 translation initiation factor IF-2 [Marivirga aurantiaca]
MSEEKMMRLNLAARKLNVGLSTITDFLSKKGFEVDSKPNSKISEEQFNMLAKEFASSAMEKEEASGLTIGKKHNSNVTIDSDGDAVEKEEEEDNILIKNTGAGSSKQSQEAPKTPAKEEEPSPAKKEDDDSYKSEAPKLQGIKVLGKIDLGPKKNKEPEAPVKKEEPTAEKAAKPEDTKKPEEPKKEEISPSAEKPKEEVQPTKETDKPVETPKADGAKEEKADDKAEVKETPKAQEEAKKPEEAQPAAKEETPKETPKEEEKVEEKTIAARADALKGLTVLGKIELPKEKDRKGKKGVKPVASSDDKKEARRGKRPRKRIATNAPGATKPQESRGAGSGTGATAGGGGAARGDQRGGRPDQRGGAAAGGRRGRVEKVEPTEKEIQEQIKQTMARLSGKGNTGGAGGNRSKYRKEKRQSQADRREGDLQEQEEQSKVLRTTEFISANDLASMMDVSVNDVIAKCMALGIFASINQRLDAETITIIADEFGFDVKFTEADDETEVTETVDNPEDLTERAPIVTIMGHVDHGKTSLLDYIREAKVTEGEAGGITQHIGAYSVETESGKRVAFLDTPGHEAFTAMRARGAKITDVVVIVVAADDAVMPQTKEAINHAQVAGVPMVIAINKIDRPNANPDKIKEELANINILVEDWGGKYQCQEISAKTGQGIDDLLEKVLLEAEVLELTANVNRNATGTVVEAELDKGRGYVTTIMVQSGTLKVGDVLLAGSHYGKVKAMFDHRGKKLQEAGPSTPVLMLGLDGAPQAGDRFNVMDNDREAREIANKREQIQREQSMRTKKHITLDEIGRRLAIGSFKELNVIIKGDVDGSIEALADSLLKLSNEEIQVKIIHKAVGQISESDVLLASASDAIVIGFQVRPSQNARKIAEAEEIEIRLYSIIYDAINEIKDAMEGMLAPTTEEVITGNIEVREVFKITKVGTVAGCMVTDGYVKRNNQIRLIRDGIVKYTGEIDQLKRYKDDVAEVKKGYECGISIKGYNDIEIGDIIEGFEEKEVKRKLK